MTLHNLKRRHLHWGETEENIKQLDMFTELDIDEIEKFFEHEEKDSLAIDDVLEASDKNFMASILQTDHQNKTLVTVLEGKFQ